MAGATQQAEAVVAYCAAKGRCNEVIIGGGKIFSFENWRLEKFETVLGAHTAIKIVAAGEEFHLPVTALTELFQAHEDVNVVLPIADPHLFGAKIAPEPFRSHVASLYL